MKRRVPEEAWFQCALRYLARFDRTAAQVESFLTRKGASAVQAKQTISRLSTLRYLDDRAFAERWIEMTLSRRPMGRARLEKELLVRGISKSLVEDVIRQGLRGRDEETLARRAVGLEGGRGRRLLLRQTVSLLRRRGFEEETIERIIGSNRGVGEQDS